ncbi:MAG: polysaccharide deacetylase family protein [Nonlabens sp.]
MPFYPDRIPDWISGLWSGLFWHGDRRLSRVYLTFDDGPTPGVTDFVLEQLTTYDFKATFFCIGDCVARNKALFHKIESDGHKLGNHTYHHLNAWRSSTTDYLQDVDKAARLIDSKLFRPPYGKINPALAKQLMHKGYTVVMWDVLSGDFDQSRSPVSILKNLKKNTQNGSVIVFHDSLKSEVVLKQVLPLYLRFLKDQEYDAVAIEPGV